MSKARRHFVDFWEILIFRKYSGEPVIVSQTLKAVILWNTWITWVVWKQLFPSQWEEMGTYQYFTIKAVHSTTDSYVWWHPRTPVPFFYVNMWGNAPKVIACWILPLLKQGSYSVPAAFWKWLKIIRVR